MGKHLTHRKTPIREEAGTNKRGEKKKPQEKIPLMS